MPVLVRANLKSGASVPDGLAGVVTGGVYPTGGSNSGGTNSHSASGEMADTARHEALSAERIDRRTDSCHWRFQAVIIELKFTRFRLRSGETRVNQTGLYLIKR